VDEAQVRRALDLAYEQERLEREERRGLETRAAAISAALLVLIATVAGFVPRVNLDKVPDDVKLSLFLLPILVALTLLVLAFALGRVTSDVRKPHEDDELARRIERDDAVPALRAQDDKIVRIVRGNRQLLEDLRWASRLMGVCVIYTAVVLAVVVSKGGFAGETGKRGPQGRPGQAGPPATRAPRARADPAVRADGPVVETRGGDLISQRGRRGSLPSPTRSH